ncbi:hypothetical protein ABPG75_004695 [Micractinium tetrahymenae]
MQAIASARLPVVAAAPPRRARAARPLRAAPRPSLVGRTRASASDVGKYLSEAASRIFHPQADNVPWEAGSQAFTGKILHHEESARLKALQKAVDSAAKDIEKGMDQAPEEADDTTTYKGNLVGEEGSVGAFILSSIQRVFGHNFKGDESEPRQWVSTGYASSGRHRSQRALRHEYERLQRFRSVVKKVVDQAEKAAEPEPAKRDM